MINKVTGINEQQPQSFKIQDLTPCCGTDHNKGRSGHDFSSKEKFAYKVLSDSDCETTKK